MNSPRPSLGANRFSVPAAAGAAPALKSHLSEGYHYDLVHEDVWKLLFAWYGMVPDQVPFPRKVIGPSFSPIV